jgi:hypothetical protein
MTFFSNGLGAIGSKLETEEETRAVQAAGAGDEMGSAAKPARGTVSRARAKADKAFLTFI